MLKKNKFIRNIRIINPLLKNLYKKLLLNKRPPPQPPAGRSNIRKLLLNKMSRKIINLKLIKFQIKLCKKLIMILFIWDIKISLKKRKKILTIWSIKYKKIVKIVKKSLLINLLLIRQNIVSQDPQINNFKVNKIG